MLIVLVIEVIYEMHPQYLLHVYAFFLLCSNWWEISVMVKDPPFFVKDQVHLREAALLLRKFEDVLFK